MLIAKRFPLERNVLARVLKNLGYDFETLEDTDKLESMLAKNTYSVVFADEEIVDGKLNLSSKNTIIITDAKSKEEIKEIMKFTRG